MITDEEVVEILHSIREFRPARIFNKVDESTAGMRFVMVYLREHNNDVYASTIAKKLGISRARMGVLIGKLVSKGLVEKTISSSDARIEVIKLTPLGEQEINSARARMIENLRHIIEEIGLDEMKKFISTSAKIKNVLEDMDE